MEVAFKRFHVGVQEAAILTDAVAADRRLAFGYPLFKKRDGLRLGFGHGGGAVFDALGQATATVGAGVPFVHAGQHFIAVVDGDDRTFSQGIEVAVGNDGGHFDNDVVVRVQTGHFQVDPDQVLRVLHNGLQCLVAQFSLGVQPSC